MRQYFLNRIAEIKTISPESVLSLIKYRVSIAVSFTAVTGYIVYTGHVDWKVLLVALGVFFFASGASGLNEVQEHKYDALMDRTKNRPIPSGQLSPHLGFVISFGFVKAGFTLLFLAFGIVPALLGLLNIFWYNGVYTYLKRVSSFAVVPGSLVGAIPAFIGWTAAGGKMFDPTIVSIAFFLFIWQIPHFWLLMLKYGKEYEQAGFRTINQAIQTVNLKKIIFTWVVATSVISIAIPLYLTQLSWVFFAMVFVLNLAFIGIFTSLAFGKSAELNLKKSFISINVYMMLFMLFLIAFHMYSV